MHKILRTNDARRKLRLRKAIEAFRTNAFIMGEGNAKKINKRKLVAKKFENTLGNMFRAINRFNERTHVSQAFRAIKENYTARV